MSDIYALYILLTSDNNQDTLCLSSDKLENKLPILKITSPKNLHREARYYARKFFSPKEMIFNEQCNYNYLAVQHEYSLNYVTEHEKQFDPEKDIVLTYGGITPFQILSEQYFWHKLIYNHDYMGYYKDKNLNLLIDHTIQHMIV